MLAGETIQSFGHQVLEAVAGLSNDPAEIVSSDLKLYEAGMKLAIPHKIFLKRGHL